MKGKMKWRQTRIKKPKKPKNTLPSTVFPRGAVYKETKPRYSAPTIRHGSQTYYKKMTI